MSVMGQEQTYAPQQVMSALLPRADNAVQEVMSAMGQKRTCRFQLLRSCVAALGHLQAWGHGRAAIFLESELG